MVRAVVACGDVSEVNGVIMTGFVTILSMGSFAFLLST